MRTDRASRAWRYVWLAASLLLLGSVDARAAGCTWPRILGPYGNLYTNGLPLVGQSIEIGGEYVKVVVEARGVDCRKLTPGGLSFAWEVFGPNGPVALEDATTLKPHFRPLVAGTYEARLIYCPQTCWDRPVRDDDVDIPPQITTITLSVAQQIQVPPATQPVLTRAASKPSPDAQAQADSENVHRFNKCAEPIPDVPEVSTPQLVTVRPWNGAADYRLLEGRIRKATLASNDNVLNHDSHDVGIHVVPDPRHDHLKLRGQADMEVEWESDPYPGSMRPSAGDRISTVGFQTYDCHHQPIPTEIHPPVLTAVHRARPVRVPDNWPWTDPLGTNIWVPGIVTDIWANVHAGEISSNCSLTGLHQGAIGPLQGFPPFIYGPCIQAPHPLARPYTFEIFLPENPQARAARAGLAAPPVPLFVSVEPGPGPTPTVVQDVDEDGVTFLRVTVDLSGFGGQFYERRIVAAWVLPNPTNWGLQRWKVGIPSMQVFDDHDPEWDGEWVFWASVNNRDQEWTQLLDEQTIDEGNYDFGGRAWETESPFADRSLGPHLLLFDPPYATLFPGPPELDLTRSLELHTSGYEDDAVWSDQVGIVQSIFMPHAVPGGAGQRTTLTASSKSGDGKDYELTYFLEQMGSVVPELTSAGYTLVDGYMLGEPACVVIRFGLCIVLPPTVLAHAWDPMQQPTSPDSPEFDWYAHPMYEGQEPEPLSLAEMPLDVLGRAVQTTLDRYPPRGLGFFAELREEYDDARGTPLEADYARALEVLEPYMPREQWKHYFGDIDPGSGGPP